ncbi:unnamed protein product [[Candida] boidinii]|nr:unnamed protein product [[Candida] boidinii]
MSHLLIHIKLHTLLPQYNQLETNHLRNNFTQGIVTTLNNLERFERERINVEQYQREQHEREQYLREKYEREQYERQQYEREQYEREQYGREQIEREQYYFRQKFPGQQPQREQELLQRQILSNGYVSFDQRRESAQPGLVLHQEPTSGVQPGFPKQFPNLPQAPFQQHPPPPTGIPLDYQKSHAPAQYAYQSHQSTASQSRQLRHPVTQIPEPLELGQQYQPVQHQKVQEHYHHEVFPAGNGQITPHDVNGVKRQPSGYFQTGQSYEQNPLSTANHVHSTIIPAHGVSDSPHNFAGTVPRPQYYYSDSEPMKHQQPLQPGNLMEERKQSQPVVQKQPYYIYLDKNNGPNLRTSDITKASDQPYEVKTFQLSLSSASKPKEEGEKSRNSERKHSVSENYTEKDVKLRELKFDAGKKKLPKTVSTSMNVDNDAEKIVVTSKTKESDNNSVDSSLVPSAVSVTVPRLKTKKSNHPKLQEVLNSSNEDETEDNARLNTEVKDHIDSTISTDTEQFKEHADSKRVFLKRTFIEVTDPTKKRVRKSSKRVHIEKRSELNTNNNSSHTIKRTKPGENKVSANRKSKKTEINASNLIKDNHPADDSTNHVSHSLIKSEADLTANRDQTSKTEVTEIAENVELKNAIASEKEAAEIICQLLTDKKSQNTITEEIKRLENEVLSGLNDIEKNLALSKNEIYLKKKGDLLKKYYSLCDENDDADDDDDDGTAHEVKEIYEKDFKDIDIRGVQPFNDFFSPIESDLRERTEFEKLRLANLQKAKDNANVKLYFDESLHIYSKICTEVGTRLLRLKNFLLHQKYNFETIQNSSSNQIKDVQSSKSEQLWKSFMGESINDATDEEKSSEKQSSISNLIFQNFNEFSPIISEEELLILTDPNSPLYDQFVIKQREHSKTGEGSDNLKDDTFENSVSRTGRRRSRDAKKINKKKKEVISSEDEIDELIKFFKVDLFNVIEKSEAVDRKSNYFNQLFSHWDSNNDISSTINKHSTIDSTKSNNENNLAPDFEQPNNTRKSFNMSSGVETYNSRTGISTASNNSQNVKNPYLKLFLSAIYLKETGKNSVPKALRGLGNEKSSKDGINAEPSGKRTTSRLRAARMEAVEKGNSLNNGKSGKKEIYTSALIDYDDMDKIVLKFQSPLSLNNNEISEDIKTIEEASKITTQG